MGLFTQARERLGSLWNDDDEESGQRRQRQGRDRSQQTRPAGSRDEHGHAERDTPAAATAPTPARTQEEHEEEDEGGGGLLGMVSNAIRHPSAVAAGAVRAVGNAVGQPVLAELAAPVVENAARQLEHAVAPALGGVQEAAANYVDHDVRRALVGNGEDGEGLIGQMAEGVGAAQELMTTGTRALASNQTFRSALESATLGAVTGDEILQESDDLTRSLTDMVDEDLRDAVAGERLHAPADPGFELEDPQAQLDVERRARQLFDATDGLGTDPAQISASMRGASPETISAMEAFMWREHHIDMRHTLDRELSGSAEDEILGTEHGPAGMISGDPVEQALSEIGGATHGLITEPDRLEAAIRAVPAARREEVIERMGGPQAARQTLLHETLGQDPTGADGRVTAALLEGNEARAVALRLDESLNRGFGETVGRALGVDDQAISDFDRNIQSWMTDRACDLAGADAAGRERARRELGGHTPIFSALNDIGGNQDEVARQLENIPESQREAVEQSFAQITGVRGDRAALQNALEREMEDGPEQDRAVALLQGNRAEADAAALQLAADQPLLSSSGFLEHVFLAPIAVTEDIMNGGQPDTSATDTEAFMHVLERREGENEEQYRQRREAMDHVLNERYGHGVDDLMTRELGEGSLDYQRARDLSDDGEMDWRLQIRYASEREIGTDEEMYLAALRRGVASGEMTDEQRTALREQAFEGPLSELDGRPALEAQEILEGPPANDAEQVDRWIRRHEFDRDTVGHVLVDMHSQSGTDYDRHLRELEAIRGRMQNGNVREEDRARFEQLGRILTGDQTSYRTRQDETAEVAAEVAATTAATVATVASAGTLAPAAAAAVSALAGGAAGMGMRGAVLGDAYEREAMAADAARAIASAAAGSTGKALERLNPGNLATRTLVELPGQAITHGTDIALSEEDLTWGTLGEHALDGGREALASGLGSTVEDHVAEHAGPGLRGRLLSKVAGSVTENVSGNAANGETWEHGIDEGLARVAGQGLRGGVQSAITTAGSHVVSEARRTPTRLVVDPEAAAAADADTADSLVSEILAPADEQPAVETSRRSDGGGDGPPPAAAGIDARRLLELQSQHGAEIAVSAPRRPDGRVSAEPTISVGTSDGVSVPDGHVGSVHTHPGATDDPRVRFPSGGQGDLASVRRHGNTQAVVHDEGVTVFHPGREVVEDGATVRRGGSVSNDIDGLAGEHGSVQPVARQVDNMTVVETTQVVLNHDEQGSVIISPSPDNPEQGMLPVSFPQGVVYGPGTSADNVEALRAHNEAQQAEAARTRDEAEAVRAGNEGRTIVGWTAANEPVFDGDRPTERWQDAQGRWRFPSEED